MYDVMDWYELCSLKHWLHTWIGRYLVLDYACNLILSTIEKFTHGSKNHDWNVLQTPDSLIPSKKSNS